MTSKESSDASTRVLKRRRSPSVRLRLVMSYFMAMKCLTTPSGSRTGATVTSSVKNSPFLRLFTNSPCHGFPPDIVRHISA